MTGEERSFKHLSFLRLRKSRSIFASQKLTSCAQHRGWATGGGTDLQTRNCRQFLLIREQLRSRSWTAVQLCKLWQRATKNRTKPTGHWAMDQPLRMSRTLPTVQILPNGPAGPTNWSCSGFPVPQRNPRIVPVVLVVYNCTWWVVVQLLRPSLCYTRYRARAARDWQ